MHLAVLYKSSIGCTCVPLSQVLLARNVVLNPFQVRDYIQAVLCPAKRKEDASLVPYKLKTSCNSSVYNKDPKLVALERVNSSNAHVQQLACTLLKPLAYLLLCTVGYKVVASRGHNLQLRLVENANTDSC